jgi:hypothetical protein
VVRCLYRQLEPWQAQRSTASQREEVPRLQGVQRDLRLVLEQILELADEPGHARFERQLAKSDLVLGLDYVLGSCPRPWYPFNSCLMPIQSA